jgi:hypothetical protein
MEQTLARIVFVFVFNQLNSTQLTPKTATVELTSHLQVFQTAPKPVETPHPKRQTLSKGAFSSILAQLMAASVVYSAIVLHPIK